MDIPDLYGIFIIFNCIHVGSRSCLYIFALVYNSRDAPVGAAVAILDIPFEKTSLGMAGADCDVHCSITAMDL